MYSFTLDNMFSSISNRIRPMAIITLVIAMTIGQAQAFPDPGQWDYTFDEHMRQLMKPKSLFAGSEIHVRIICDSIDHNTPIFISWHLAAVNCWPLSDKLRSEIIARITNNTNGAIHSPVYERMCNNGNHIILPELKTDTARADIGPEGAVVAGDRGNVGGAGDNVAAADAEADRDNPLGNMNKRDVGFGADEHGPIILNSRQSVNTVPIYTTQYDAVYLLILQIDRAAGSQQKYNASVHIEMRSADGYLSAADWPFLPFYGLMCLVYVVYGIIWLTVSFLQWRDLLRIQFWIGGVILMGMLEKAMFYFVYQAVNATGRPVSNAYLMAAWVSCGKRTLARMLVIIVSLGFGIVKPRLGPMLHRVVGTGALYFMLACVESYMIATYRKSDPNSQLLVARIPLAVLDSAICWWIFTSLVQTTRTLRLRRNMVKLTLYRHFTNTLIFAVMASVVFMLYSIMSHNAGLCATDWETMWQDEGFWHILFSFLLLVIMILWRPTNNNQRYAFTPLLDNPEDDDEDDEEEQFVSDVYGVKMRGSRSFNSKMDNPHKTTNEEDDLRWVEENIPTSIADVTLPILDSDEEIINTRFEVSKMQ